MPDAYWDANLHTLLCLLLFASAQVFHAGTARNAAGELVSNGGRVLGVTALGKDIAEAQSKAYQVGGVTAATSIACRFIIGCC